MTAGPPASPARSRSGRPVPGSRGRPTLALALVLAVAACGGPAERAGPVPDSVYVEAMARMVLLDTAVSPSLEPAPEGPVLDSARQRVLRRYGVDTEGLLEFARASGDDPRRMETLWRRVYELSDSLKRQRWEPPTGPPPADGDVAPPDTGADGDRTIDSLRPDSAAPGADTVAGRAEDGRGRP